MAPSGRHEAPLFGYQLHEGARRASGQAAPTEGVTMLSDNFGMVKRIRRELDDALSGMALPPEQPCIADEEPWMPRITMVRRGDNLVLRAELPGVKPADVDLSVDDSSFTLKGHRHVEETHEDECWILRESTYGAFERTVPIPKPIDPGMIVAVYEDGVLQVTLRGAFEGFESPAPGAEGAVKFRRRDLPTDYYDMCP